MESRLTKAGISRSVWDAMRKAGVTIDAGMFPGPTEKDWVVETRHFAFQIKMTLESDSGFGHCHLKVEFGPSLSNVEVIGGTPAAEIVADDVLFYFREFINKHTQWVSDPSVGRTVTDHHCLLEFALYSFTLDRSRVVRKITSDNDRLNEDYRNAMLEWQDIFCREITALMKQAAYNMQYQGHHGVTLAEILANQTVVKTTPVPENYGWLKGIEFRFVELNDNGSFVMLGEFLLEDELDKGSNPFWRNARLAAYDTLVRHVHQTAKDLFPLDAGWAAVRCQPVTTSHPHYTPYRKGLYISVN